MKAEGHKHLIDWDMKSDHGWLLPNGHYYKCDWMQHLILAEKLLADESKHQTIDHEQLAEKKGWIKISAEIIYHKHTEATQKQLDKLFDFCELHGKDYEDLIGCYYKPPYDHSQAEQTD